MASSAHKTEEEKKEFFDNDDELEAKVTVLADMIKKSKYFVAFTGAGISTACGIPDFRSGINTVLPTGPGAWEKLAKGQPRNKNVKVSMLKAVPSKTHMALVQLQQLGLLKSLISQNIDGLHRRSGFPPERLAEVHGNTNLEKCTKCKKEFLRDFRVRTAQNVHDHKTGRKCPDCKGEMIDSIINFGENLPQKDLDMGFEECSRADLCLAMGSSLRVTPAADMPALVGQKKKDLVVINIQKTPLDKLCSLRIYALCDRVIEMVMEKLGLPIIPFLLQRRIQVTYTSKQTTLQGVDSDGCLYQYIKEVKYGSGTQAKVLNKEPFILPAIKQETTVKLSFFGNYNEPDLNFIIPPQDPKDQKIKQVFKLSYNPQTGQWSKPTLI